MQDFNSSDSNELAVTSKTPQRKNFKIHPSMREWLKKVNRSLQASKKLLLIASFSSGCGLASGSATSAHAQANNAEPSRVQEQEIRELIDRHLAPELSEPGRLRVSFCPRWNQMTTNERRETLQHFFVALARAESNFRPHLMYFEPSISGRDLTTGQEHVSEGLLQLSYQDARIYGCRFDYDREHREFQQDFEARNERMSWKAQNSHRSILQPDRNLECGARIANRLLLSSRNAQRDLLQVMGAYWGTLRSGRPSRNKIIREVQQRMPACQTAG